ncbi:COMM domain-containing protein 9 isoform X1 [Erpetoichthys calabaricus]|uniref:COMM domain containing 9 n=1 Tax=Erpetoichthys calabaricus TaxID=27687 RepID=A0A8C4RHN4_ERPCA|nr:COMM domain-containing protein 9 isoform X1 [Erpetoichthys calabaricus]
MDALTVDDFTALQLLLKAPSKEVVRQLCQESFASGSGQSAKLIESACRSLSVTREEAQQLLGALHCLSRHVLFHGMASPEEIFTAFPASFHPNLKNLLTKILLEQSPAWRNDVLAKQISLPQLVDMDWRVDIKTSSDSVRRMAMPTCLVQIKVQDDPGLCQSNPVESTVMVELSKETLETMLDGLGKIRDQLSTVANK